MTNTKQEQIRVAVKSVDDQLELLRSVTVSKDPEVSSLQYTDTAGGITNHILSDTDKFIEVYVELGTVRVRTDGELATATTGEPLAQGYYDAWSTSLSVYAVTPTAIYTVIHR